MDEGVSQELFMTAEESGRCKTCKYRTTVSGTTVCYYCGFTGIRRGCSVKDCNKYEKGRYTVKQKGMGWEVVDEYVGTD